jgi:CRP-like cAMP-binding protein
LLVATRVLSPFIAKLSRYGSLSEAERVALSEAVGGTQTYDPSQLIVTEGGAPGGVHILVEGVAQRHKTLVDGSRQIISIDLPGDTLTLSAFLRGALDYSVCALTTAVTVRLGEAHLWQLIGRYPRIGRALWTDMARDLVVAQEWMVSLGRRSGYARVAHLLCETYVRIERLGAARDHRCRLPLTQAELADALGLSCVHINRVLQQLRREGLISLTSGQLVIKDWDRLAEAAGFSPHYLSPIAPSAMAIA